MDPSTWQDPNEKQAQPANARNAAVAALCAKAHPANDTRPEHPQPPHPQPPPTPRCSPCGEPASFPIFWREFTFCKRAARYHNKAHRQSKRQVVGRGNTKPCTWVSSFSLTGQHIFQSPPGPSSNSISQQASTPRLPTGSNMMSNLLSAKLISASWRMLRNS